MNRFSRTLKTAFVLLFSLVSLQNMYVGSLVSVAHAAGCSLDPATHRLVIFSDSGSDPQTITVGQVATKYWVQIRDMSDTVTPSDCTTYVALSFDAALVIKTDAVGNPDPGNVTISKNVSTARASFFLKGADKGDVVITASTTTGPSNPSQQIDNNGIQNLSIIAPAPKPLYGITNFAHGTQDTIQGDVGAIEKAGVVSGIKVRAYSNALGHPQIGTDVLAASDGSFPTIETGDDQYRTIFLRAVYPGTASVLSDELKVDLNYPPTLTKLEVTHGANDRPYLTWPAADPADEITFAVYRTLADTPAFADPPLAIVATPFYEDNSVSYTAGVKYRYAVKQIYEASYTPEFLPVAEIRLDLSTVVFLPAGSSTNETKPTITFTVTPDLLNQWNLDHTVVKAQYTNTATNVVYSSTVVATDPALFMMMASGPYLDSVGASLPSLPDGSYTSKLVADDSILVAPNVPLGIMDLVTNVVTYSIDSVLPTAPLLSKLRYSNSILYGIAGAVEPNVFVDVYSSANIIPANKLGTTTADANGAFQFTAMPIPAGGIFYLVARDAAGNSSPTTAFDVVTLPVAPDATKLTLEMNKPGTEDHLLGSAGAVAALATVRIFGADPAANPNLVPLYEFLANSDGSFSQNVGDNKSSAFWVAVWNGAGHLSSAVKLSNATTIAAPTSFTAIGGDNSVTLHWNLVSGAAYYTIEVYNISSKQNISTATVSGTQTSLRLTLANGSAYRFYIHAVDAGGNLSLPVEVESTPAAPQIVYAVATINNEPAAAEVVRPSSVAKVEPNVSAESTPEPASTPAKEPETRDWTWLIVGLGIVLLGLAWYFGRQLWTVDASETVVTTVKKADAKKTTESTKKVSDEKPRW